MMMTMMMMMIIIMIMMIMKLLFILEEWVTDIPRLTQFLVTELQTQGFFF